MLNMITLTDFYPSGQEVIVSHKWDKRGSYEIKAKAITTYGYESGWGTLEVRMPLSQPGSQQSSQLSTIPLFFQILQRLMNTR